MNLAMAYKPAKWPSYALEALEDTLSLLKDIEKETAAAQQAVVDGDKLTAVIVMSAVRTGAMKAHSTLIQAKAGKYSD